MCCQRPRRYDGDQEASQCHQTSSSLARNRTSRKSTRSTRNVGPTTPNTSQKASVLLGATTLAWHNTPTASLFATLRQGGSSQREPSSSTSVSPAAHPEPSRKSINKDIRSFWNLRHKCHVSSPVFRTPNHHGGMTRCQSKYAPGPPATKRGCWATWRTGNAILTLLLYL